MDYERSKLNHFLVNVFNEILKTEESMVSKSEFPNLSLREIHVIEAVCNAEDKHTENKSLSIAADLRVTAGTLTTSVSLLEKKGYLFRKKDSEDKRVVRIYATQLGREANKHHEKFHEEMINTILYSLTENETEVFVKALSGIAEFFRTKFSK